MQNIMKTWHRDGAQGPDPRKWASPDLRVLDFSLTDKHMIGGFTRVGIGGNYDWVKDPARDNKYVQSVEVSIWKMLTHPKIMDEMLMDAEGKTYDVHSLHLECIGGYDHPRQLTLTKAKKYPKRGSSCPYGSGSSSERGTERDGDST